MLLTHLSLIFVLFSQNALGGQKLMCNFDDSDCLTKSVRKAFQDVINLRSVIPPMESAHVDEIRGDSRTLKYIAHDVTLSGITSCIPELVKINSKDMSYEYHIRCKHLSMEGQYEGKGEVGSMFVDGKGDFKADFYDYGFLFNGGYELFYDKNERLHFHLKNFNLEIDAKCKVVYEFKNLYYDDKKRAALMHKFINENWTITDNAIRRPGMNAFMAAYFKELNAYLKETPIEDIFSNEI